MGKAAGGVVFDQVSKHYGEVKAVDAVSFTVSPGELVTLLGPSGCGKTTILRMVAGLEPVTSGHIAIGGTDVTLRAANEPPLSGSITWITTWPPRTNTKSPPRNRKRAD